MLTAKAAASPSTPAGKPSSSPWAKKSSESVSLSALTAARVIGRRVGSDRQAQPSAAVTSASARSAFAISKGLLRRKQHAAVSSRELAALRLATSAMGKSDRGLTPGIATGGVVRCPSTRLVGSHVQLGVALNDVACRPQGKRTAPSLARRWAKQKEPQRPLEERRQQPRFVHSTLRHFALRTEQELQRRQWQQQRQRQRLDDDDDDDVIDTHKNRDYCLLQSAESARSLGLASIGWSSAADGGESVLTRSSSTGDLTCFSDGWSIRSKASRMTQGTGGSRSTADSIERARSPLRRFGLATAQVGGSSRMATGEKSRDGKPNRSSKFHSRPEALESTKSLILAVVSEYVNQWRHDSEMEREVRDREHAREVLQQPEPGGEIWREGSSSDSTMDTTGSLSCAGDDLLEEPKEGHSEQESSGNMDVGLHSIFSWAKAEPKARDKSTVVQSNKEENARKDVAAHQINKDKITAEHKKKVFTKHGTASGGNGGTGKERERAESGARNPRSRPPQGGEAELSAQRPGRTSAVQRQMEESWRRRMSRRRSGTNLAPPASSLANRDERQQGARGSASGSERAPAGITPMAGATAKELHAVPRDRRDTLEIIRNVRREHGVHSAPLNAPTNEGRRTDCGANPLRDDADRQVKRGESVVFVFETDGNAKCRGAGSSSSSTAAAAPRDERAEGERVPAGVGAAGMSSFRSRDWRVAQKMIEHLRRKRGMRSGEQEVPPPKEDAPRKERGRTDCSADPPRDLADGQAKREKSVVSVFETPDGSADCGAGDHKKGMEARATGAPTSEQRSDGTLQPSSSSAAAAPLDESMEDRIPSGIGAAGISSFHSGAALSKRGCRGRQAFCKTCRHHTEIYQIGGN